MAAKHSSKSGRTRRNPAALGTGSCGARDLSSTVEDAINEERRNLQKAESVLGCLVLALEYDESDELDYSDVARAVRSMVSAAITGLDPTSLRRAGAPEGGPHG